MQEEVIFHLQRLNRMVKIHLTDENKKNVKIKEILESCVSRSDEHIKAMN